jgi:hypothetical protein
MSWYQRARDQYGMFIKREFPTALEECFQSPIAGAIYAEIVDQLRVNGAIRPSAVDNSALFQTAWDIGAPLNTVVWYFQIVAAEFRVNDCDTDLDLTPVQRVARMFAKGYPHGTHFPAARRDGYNDQREDVSQRTCQHRPAQPRGDSSHE